MTVQDSDFVIIKDYLKEISIAVVEFFLHVTQSYCNKHLCNNVRNKSWRIMALRFWVCTYVKTESAFDKLLEDIKELNEDTAKCISNII